MIFYKQLDKIDPSDPTKALLSMERQIRYIQDQLEYTLTNLDSSNITEIDTDITDITSPGDTDSIIGLLYLTGKNGEVFKVGFDPTVSGFVFALSGKNGKQYMYMPANGNLIISKNTSITIDGGEW